MDRGFAPVAEDIEKSRQQAEGFNLGFGQVARNFIASDQLMSVDSGARREKSLAGAGKNGAWFLPKREGL
jgi:hypothetical protein